MKIRALLALLAVSVSFSQLSSAWAGGYIQLSGAPIFQKTDRYSGDTGLGGTFEAKTINAASGLGYDFRGTLGYAFWNKMLVGFTYDTGRAPLKGEAVPNQSAGRDQLEKFTDMGPTLGLIAGRFHFLGTYLFSGKRSYSDKDIDDGSGLNMRDNFYEQKLSSGFQVNVGYTAPLSRIFSLGISLIYKSASYKSGTFTSAENPADNYTDRAFTSKPVEAELNPMISMVFAF